MTIDINELRRLAQAATPGHWQFWHGWVAADIDNDGGVIIVERPTPSGGKYQARVDNNFKFIAAADPQAISELLDRLEEAEKERDDVAQQLVQSEIGKREIEKERDAAELMSLALRAKIIEMERQEPVAWVRGRDDHRRRKLSFERPTKSSPDKLHWSPLVYLPGAQGEKK